MKCLIEGAQAQSGRDVRIIIEAATLAEAERQANIHGIFVTSVRPAVAGQIRRKLTPVLPYESAQPAGHAPNYKLFATLAPAQATILGGPVAGAVVLAINFYRLGRKMAAGLSVTLGVVASALLFLLAMNVPKSVPAMLFWFAPWLIVHSLSKVLQNKDVDQHVRQGGEVESNGMPILIGLVSMVLVGGTAFALLYH